MLQMCESLVIVNIITFAFCNYSPFTAVFYIHNSIEECIENTLNFRSNGLTK